MPTKKRRPKVEKTAISLPSDLLAHAHQMVREGVAPSLSGYFAALTRRDHARRELGVFVAELEEQLGMTDTERARIDADLGFAKSTRKAG
jgi:uncharacterized membrane protein YebE (DUF533 family)